MFGFNLFGDTTEYIVEIYEGNQCVQRNKMALPDVMRTANESKDD